MLHATKHSLAIVHNLPIWLFILTLPVVMIGAYYSTTTFENDLGKWPSTSTKVRQDIDDFQQQFESTDVLLVTWDGCNVNDPRLVEVAGALKDGVLSDYIEEFSDGLSVLNVLTKELGISDVQARKRLQGSFLGQDGSSTYIYLSLNEFGSKNRPDLIERLTQLLVGHGVSKDAIKFAGPAFELYSIDIEGFWSPLRAVPFIALLSMLLVWFFVKRFKLALFIFSMSGYTGSLALTIVYFSGTSLNALVWTMPTLVLLLTTSAALHYLGYYRSAMTLVGPDAVHQLAFSKAWRPITYCSVTTAVGLFSLTLSDMTPVQQFGTFGGVSVLASSCVVLACLPNWLRLFPPSWAPSISHQDPGNFWQRLARITTQCRRPILLVITVCASLLLAAVPAIKTSTHIDNFFPHSNKIVRDANWFTDNLGGQTSIELLLTFQNANESNDSNRLRMLEYLQRKYTELDNVTGVFSAATYAPRWPKRRKSIGTVLRRKTVDVQVRAIKSDSVAAGLIFQGKEAETWRMSLRILKNKETSVAKLVEQVERIALDTFANFGNTLFKEETLSVKSTGQAVLFEFVEQQFLNDLVLTYATAFALITIVVFLIMRSFVFVGIATPPNLLPAVLVLGGVAASGRYLDVGSLMTASVALGIAVDDTLHFVLWWRERVRAGDSTQLAIVDSMEHCGTAMFQTTMVCGLSIALYAYCGFLPTVRFGLLLSAMLFAALIGDLLLLPALLATRLGRWVRPAACDP